MTELLVAAGLATTAAAGSFVAVWPSRDRLVRQRLRDRVVVTLKTGAAFRGVLFEADARSFVLRNAEMFDGPGETRVVPVDGELVLARADVEYVQRP